MSGSLCLFSTVSFVWGGVVCVCICRIVFYLTVKKYADYIYIHLKITTPKMMREDAMLVKSDMTPSMTFSYENWKSSEDP